VNRETLEQRAARILADATAEGRHDADVRNYTRAVRLAEALAAESILRAVRDLEARRREVQP
jgi:hypothetical protein